MSSNHLYGGVHDKSGKLGGPGYPKTAGSKASLEERPGVRNPGALAGAIHRRIMAHQSGGPMRSEG